MRDLSGSPEFLTAHSDLLLHGEAHSETTEAILWSLDPIAAPRRLSEEHFIPELDEEIGEVAVSQVSANGFCALFGPSVSFSTRKVALLVFPF